jgi:hypothetical protein
LIVETKKTFSISQSTFYNLFSSNISMNRDAEINSA